MTWREKWELAYDQKQDSTTYKQNLVDWCSRKKWGWMVLQTFRSRVSRSGARVLFCRFLADLHLRFGVTAALWASEEHQKGSFHVHALLCRRPMRFSSRRQTFVPDFRSESRYWRDFKEFGWQTMGLCRPRRIRNSAGAAVRYCFKYLLKTADRDPDFDWDLWQPPDAPHTMQMDES